MWKAGELRGVPQPTLTPGRRPEGTRPCAQGEGSAALDRVRMPSFFNRIPFRSFRDQRFAGTLISRRGE
jgi:hypothetical protein